jgi:hypothetical protein
MKICEQHVCTFLKLKKLHTYGVPLWLVYLKAGLSSITRQLKCVMSYGQHIRSGLHVVYLGLRATAELENKFHVSPQVFHSVILLQNVKPYTNSPLTTLWNCKPQCSSPNIKFKIQVKCSNSYPMWQAQTPLPITILPSTLPSAVSWLQYTLSSRTCRYCLRTLFPPVKIFFLSLPPPPFILHLVNQKTNKFKRSSNPLNPEPPATITKGLAWEIQSRNKNSDTMDQNTGFKRAAPMEFTICLGTRHYTQIGFEVLIFYHREK